MITIEALKTCGVDVADGLNRCMNNEGFYLRLVNLALADGNFDKLSEAVGAGDRKAAFEAAHALKGVLGNLSLTPLYRCASEITELLREGSEADYAALVGRLTEERGRLQAL